MTLCVIFIIVFLSATVFGDNVESVSRKILQEQIRELSCTLSEQELSSVAQKVLKQDNVSYDSFRKTFDSSKRMVAALRALMKRPGNSDAIFREFELEKHGISMTMWNNYSQIYTTDERIARLEKMIPVNDDEFFRMVGNSFKANAEGWILAQKILMDYDRLHPDNLDEKSERKFRIWWDEKLKVRFPDEMYRSDLSSYLAFQNISSLNSFKYGTALEELIKSKLQFKEFDK